MKEKEFIKKLEKEKLKNGIIIGVYYWVDSFGHIHIDEDSGREEFEEFIKRLNEIEESGK